MTRDLRPPASAKRPAFLHLLPNKQRTVIALPDRHIRKRPSDVFLRSFDDFLWKNIQRGDYNLIGVQANREWAFNMTTVADRPGHGGPPSEPSFDRNV